MSLAPLPTLDDLKLTCKIDLGDPSLDGLLAAYQAAALSIIEARTNVAILDTTYTEIDRTLDMQPTATFAPPQSLILLHRPVNASIAPVILAEDGSTLVNSPIPIYYVDNARGIIYAVSGNYFGEGPYTITYHAGMVNHPAWATRYRAIAGQVVRDLVAWMYEQSDPAVHQESAGGGVSTTFDDAACPRRTCALIKLLPGGSMALGI